MKALLLLTLTTLTAFCAFSQTSKEDIDLIQAIYGKEKKAIVQDFIMPPDSARKAAFWKLYDAYETERKNYGKQRVVLLDKYAKAYATFDDKSTDEIMKETMSLQKHVDQLIITYYDKIKKSVGVKQAGQFYQIESYLLSATRVYILGNMPFIDELEKLPAPTQPGKGQ